MTRHPRYLIFLLVILVVSCHKHKDLAPPAVNSDDYYPLRVGNYHVYNVVDSKYGLSGRYDSIYQLKEAYPETWIDLEGRISYKLFRYKKPNNATSFILDSVWHAEKPDAYRVMVTENNVPFMKLSLPLVDDKRWNGNSYNIYEAETYTVSNLRESWGSYSNTVTVVHKNVSNLLYKHYSVEIYAKDIGLIYKEIQNVNLDFGTGRITDGEVLKQTLASYGTE